MTDIFNHPFAAYHSQPNLILIMNSTANIIIIIIIIIIIT